MVRNFEHILEYSKAVGKAVGKTLCRTPQGPSWLGHATTIGVHCTHPTKANSRNFGCAIEKLL
jgi:hypothetical protein